MTLIRIKEGSEATVRCTAFGTLPLITIWYRGEEPVPLEKQVRNALKVTDATLYDTGRYRCVVKNPAGEAIAETYLQIRECLMNMNVF